MLSEKEVTMQ